MITYPRLSSISNQLRSQPGEWQEINSMPTLISTSADHQTAEQIGVADLSCLTRWGVKGAQAGGWLEQYSLNIPDQINTWRELPQGGIMARLGSSEFLLEDGLGSNFSIDLSKASLTAQVYPVLRQDLAIALCGHRVNSLLQQTCAYNFTDIDLTARPVILTVMAGISVTIIPVWQPQQVYYRIWCDYNFGAYFWQTLLAIAQELGGGVIGAQYFLNN